MRAEVGGLLVWWGAWSIADDYLLKYTPVFELVSVVLGLALILWPRKATPEPAVHLVSVS